MRVGPDTVIAYRVYPRSLPLCVRGVSGIIEGYKGPRGGGDIGKRSAKVHARAVIRLEVESCVAVYHGRVRERERVC